MNAVVFKAPRQVEVETQPIPKLIDPTDVIVRVAYTGLCGSDLHCYRGVEECSPGTILGHELYGSIVEKGSEVKNFQVGESVISPFTVNCGECFYCQSGFSSRCTKSWLFGSDQLPGAQAQYVRVVLADGTLVKAVDGLNPKQLVLMGDVLPTGFFAASSGLALSQPSPHQPATSTPKPPVVVIVGCGPVGLCALISASSLIQPSHLFAIDTVPSRLEQARALGAEPLNLEELGLNGIQEKINAVTDGRGADIVLEIVGNSKAIKLGFDVLRNFGVLVSVGVHVEEFPWTMAEAYNKNPRLQFGRCPVRSIFPAALELLRKESARFDLLTQETVFMPLEKAKEAYELFEARKVSKVIFKAWEGEE